MRSNSQNEVVLPILPDLDLVRLEPLAQDRKPRQTQKGKMFKAFARVAARSIAIQLEEAAAAAKAKQPYVDPTPKIHQYSAANKGKGKVVERDASVTQTPAQQVVGPGSSSPAMKNAEQEKLVVASQTATLPDVREARRENPYMVQHTVPSEDDSKPITSPSSVTLETAPKTRSVVPEPIEPITAIPERGLPVEAALEPNPVELDETPIEPSEVIDDVDPETVSEVYNVIALP